MPNAKQVKAIMLRLRGQAKQGGAETQLRANDVKEDSGVFQLNMFIDYEALERDRKLQGAMLEVRRKFGSNALFKGMNLMEGATTLERNQQIGGHKA